MIPAARQFGAACLGVVLLCLACCPGRVQAADVKRPNFLFIIVDDQSPFDLRVYQPSSSLETPNIDRLAAGSAWHDEQVLNYLNERGTAKDARPFLIHFGFSHPHDT